MREKRKSKLSVGESIFAFIFPLLLIRNFAGSAFQEYMKCSENAVQEACGSETAEFTRNFLDKMLSSLIRVSSCCLLSFSI